MGRHLKDLKILPEIIISSPAARARQSAELIAEQLDYDVGKIHLNDEIYDASVRTLLQVVNQLKDDWAQVMMVGHNPTVTYLAEYITGAEIGNIETCGIVLIQFEVKNWIDVDANTGKFKQYLYPDLLEL